MDTQLLYIGANGSSLDLFNDNYFDLVDFDGMTSASASVYTSTASLMDGDKLNNVQANYRACTLDLRVKNGVDVELAKRHVLRVVKHKQAGTLRLTQGDRETELVGIVEAISLPRFSNECTIQIEMYCNFPYWRDAEYMSLTISRILKTHHFKLVIPAPFPLGVYDLNMTQVYTNDGDVATGCEITIIALGEVVNPTLYKADGTYIGVIDKLEANDKVVISTEKGRKFINKNGESIISKIKAGSKFLQIETGDNSFTIDAESGERNLYFTISFKRCYV